MKHKYINLFTAGMLSFLQGFCCGLLRRLSWMSWRKVQKTISVKLCMITQQGKYLQLVHVFSLGNVKFKNSNKVKSRFLQIHLPVCLNATSTGLSTSEQADTLRWNLHQMRTGEVSRQVRLADVLQTIYELRGLCNTTALCSSTV